MGKLGRKVMSLQGMTRAPLTKLKCRLRIIPQQEAEQGFTVPSNYMYFGIMQTYDPPSFKVAVIELLGTDTEKKEPEKK